MNDQDQAGLGWTVVPRRQPARIVACRAEGGYTDAHELVCCECGDHIPTWTTARSQPSLGRSAGPYPIAAGIAAHDRHVSRHHRAAGGYHSGRAARSQRRLTRQDDPLSVTAA